VFYVLCHGYKKKTCTTGRYFIPELELEEFVLNELKRLFKNRINKKELLESAKGGKVKVELEGLDKQEQALKKELDQMQNALRLRVQQKIVRSKKLYLKDKKGDIRGVKKEDAL
jgi:hypothetical protein